MVDKNIVKSVIYGVAIGDALGVPVEFLSRNDVRKINIQKMEGIDSDFEYKTNFLWDKLKKRYAEIGTVQVPHHGAKNNWKKEMGIGDPRHYIVSSGSTNSHHHPNFWVLQDIWNNGHRIFVVSEKTVTKQEYYFEVK